MKTPAKTRPARAGAGRRAAQARTANRPGRNVVLVATGVAALAAIAAFLIAKNGDDKTPGPGAEAAGDGLSHVHGLGVDPADGVLYVATHYGTFRMPEGQAPERIGDSFQDTMGFTIAGSDHFLGSGHPDAEGLQDGQPGRLGLIESTDAGETWTAVSLSGEVDFHALATAHNQVYGWDASSGRFMVSADQQRWDTRSTLDLHSFAVDPADPDRVVGATPGGVVVSTDGGRSWRNPAGPTVVLLAASPDGTTWGIEAGGQLHTSTDKGASWVTAGHLPGQPQALLAADDKLWAAAHDEAGVTSIYVSTDAGRTWDALYRDQQS